MSTPIPTPPTASASASPSTYAPHAVPAAELASDGPESLLAMSNDPQVAPRPDQRLLFASGAGDRAVVSETSSFWNRLGSRGGLLGGLLPSARRYLVRTSLRDEGANVVSWKMASRVDEDQGPDAIRIQLRVRGWVAPQFAPNFVGFACRNPGLREALEHRIEQAFMRALPRVVEELQDEGPVPSEPGMANRSNPKRLTREVERRLALELQGDLSEEEIGMTLRFAAQLPEVPPILTLAHEVSLDLQGPDLVKLRLNTKIQVRLKGSEGFVRFVASGVTHLETWCRETIEHVVRHNTFGCELLAFLSELDLEHVPRFEKQLRSEAEQIGFEVTSIFSSPVNQNGQIPEFYETLKHLTLENRGADFQTSDPVVKVRLAYHAVGRLGTLTAPRVRNTINRGERLDVCIAQDIEAAIKRVVEGRTPQSAYSDFETSQSPGLPPLRDSVVKAIQDTMAMYGAAPSEVPGADSKLIPAITVRQVEDRISILWRSLNNLSVRVSSRYESALHIHARARVDVDLRVESIAQGQTRESWTNGFLQFLRFMPGEGENSGRIDTNAVAEFIADRIRGHLDSRLSTLTPREFMGYLAIARRDVYADIPIPTDPQVKDPTDLFKLRLEQWINEFSAREFGLGIRVTNYLMVPADEVIGLIRSHDQHRLGLLQSDGDGRLREIRDLEKKLANDREFLAPNEIAEIDAKLAGLRQRVFTEGPMDALTGGPKVLPSAPLPLRSPEPSDGKSAAA